MAASMQQAPKIPAAIVANAFVKHYYLKLHQSPELVHGFYKDVSKLGRPEEDGATSITTTVQAINDKILSLDYGEFSADIINVDTQESYNRGVLVLVTGYLTGKDNVRRKFNQSFFLAPQEKGFFVLNDVFRYVDDANHGNQTSINNVEAPITPDQGGTTRMSQNNRRNHRRVPLNPAIINCDLINLESASSTLVANAFVEQYYIILHQSPGLVHLFYQDVSKLSRPEEDGGMSITTTMQAINVKILSLDYGEFSSDITTVDAQESYNWGLLVLVTGYLIGKDNVRRKFTQSFFLAPQDKGYFVLNDVFRYVDDANHGNQTSINNVEAPITPDQGGTTRMSQNNRSNHRRVPLNPAIINCDLINLESASNTLEIATILIFSSFGLSMCNPFNKTTEISYQFLNLKCCFCLDLPSLSLSLTRVFACLLCILMKCIIKVNSFIISLAERERVTTLPPPPPPPPNEPTFTCPICMGPLVEEMSTKCGHIFCKTCINSAIAAQSACPTCRKKVTVNELIRVFLPATESQLRM